jgi:hypothetical protein
MKTWTFEGCLNSGNAVFSNRKNNDLAIEKDQSFLADPTPEELSEIHSKFPYLNHVSEIRSCRVCGCTDNKCAGCIARTGKPCHWVEADLCSACFIEPVSPIPGLSP